MYIPLWAILLALWVYCCSSDSKDNNDHHDDGPW